MSPYTERCKIRKLLCICQRIVPDDLKFSKGLFQNCENFRGSVITSCLPRNQQQTFLGTNYAFLFDKSSYISYGIKVAE